MCYGLFYLVLFEIQTLDILHWTVLDIFYKVELPMVFQGRLILQIFTLPFELGRGLNNFFVCSHICDEPTYSLFIPLVSPCLLLMLCSCLLVMLCRLVSFPYY